MMVLEKYWLFVPLLAAVTTAFIGYARREQSFYFLIVAVVYAYVGLTYLVFQLDIFLSELAFLYFVFSCGAVIWFLLRYKKILSPRQP
jgi:CHASE2 domain-containing sensor protein